MQVSNTLLIVAAELYLVLFISILVLFLFSRKQKKLLDRQQQKLLELIKEVRHTNHMAITPTIIEKDYKFHLNEQLEITQHRYSTIDPAGNISLMPSNDAPLEQQILALRHAFLRVEELATTTEINTDNYWNLFNQSLTPLLQPAQLQRLKEELATYKKRVENLEQFKKLFFDLEAQWNAAQDNFESYHEQFLTLSGQMSDPEAYRKLLASFQGNYGQFSQIIKNTSNVLDNPTPKTINVIRQDPRAAEEIIKLRNVAADQYRVIHNLQRKLEEVVSDEQKNMVIQELEQQLQKQMRFLQESDTCIKLLEDELSQAHSKISQQQHIIDQKTLANDENDQIKEALHSFTLESKDLLENIEALEEENLKLKEQLEAGNKAPISNNDQEAFINLQKQYAELEERYLALKLK